MVVLGLLEGRGWIFLAHHRIKLRRLSDSLVQAGTPGKGAE